MNAVVLGSDGGSGVAAAFLEEAPSTLIVAADADLGATTEKCRALHVTSVIAASPDAVDRAASLHSALDLPAGTALSVVGPSRAAMLGTNDPTYSVDMVSLGGSHVVSATFSERVDLHGDLLLLRHRISLDQDGSVAAAVNEFARLTLDRHCVRDGATTVTVAESGGALRVVDVVGAPMSPTVPADAAFVAMGQSHQHLLAECVLRPNEFRRRFARQQRGIGRTLAVAPIRSWTDGVIVAFGGLRLIRRLTGFHSVTALVQSGTSTKAGDVCGLVAFVHEDRHSIENSLYVLHEFEETDSVFRTDLDVVGYSADAT